VDITYPANVRFQAQVYYGSIGYATASTLGMDIARKEVDGEKGRTVLVTGDGSMALTIQEIGTMIKQKLKVVIFVINNEGYTVERLIWGAQQRTCIPYSASFRHSHILKFRMY
jgi:pyruvate decarboxylase